MQRAYNTRTRPRPQTKTGICEVCGAEMTWQSGRGPDRVYCSRSCKAKADTAIQRVRREELDAGLRKKREARRERRALLDQGMRRCSMCEEVKSLTEYHVRGTGWQHRCKVCAVKYGVSRGKELTFTVWKSHLKRKYGLSVEDFTALLVAQSGRCAICLVPMDEPHVDHDHDTGAVRGLLCGRCNKGLGLFRDDPAILRAATKYLTRPL